MCFLDSGRAPGPIFYLRVVPIGGCEGLEIRTTHGANHVTAHRYMRPPQNVGYNQVTGTGAM